MFSVRAIVLESVTWVVLAFGLCYCGGGNQMPMPSQPPSNPNPTQSPTENTLTVPASFFGMSGNSGLLYSQPWPSARFGDFRLWDTATGWAQLNPGAGIYNWTVLDLWINHVQNNNSNVTYTFGRVPAWASANPTDTTCRYEPGSCDPPNDLNPDGSGSDNHWQTFVSAIVRHANGRIKTWELWNEPQNSFFWTGTIEQMIRMAKDARDIIKAADPTAIIVSPGTGLGSHAMSWTANFLAAGGGATVDAIAFHGYPSCPVTTSTLPGDISAFRNLLSTYDQGTKPLFDTEASWNTPPISCLTDPDLQAAFVAQSYVLHWSANVARFYWYQWNNPGFGTMWAPSTSAAGVILKPGLAYIQIYAWLVGASLVDSCSQNGTTWSCLLTRGSYHGLIVWDTSQSCNAGVCGTIAFSVPSEYLHYRDLSGNVGVVSAGHVRIGPKPILLENQ